MSVAEQFASGTTADGLVYGDYWLIGVDYATYLLVFTTTPPAYDV